MSESDPQIVQRRLEEFRRNLLDTSLRNRLINFRTRTKAGKPLEKVVEVRGEDPIELVRMLVAEGKAMSFVGKPDPRPAREGLFDEARLREEAEHEVDTFLATGAPVVDATDLKLNTDDTATALARKLTKIWRDARVAVEEQGVNVLFLALGSLEWREEGSEEARRAPLIMLPASLERTHAGAFRLRWDGGEPGGNLSIAAKLRAEFGIRLPEMPDELDVARYLDETERAVASRPAWEVDRFAVALGFFSYAKYLMYRDLDPLGWPEDGKPSHHATLGALLDGGFEDAEEGIDEEAFLDPLRADAREVYDADGSQALAILQAGTGRTMVIEGPPGTGKSQTITNLIAEAVGAGKKVLFVAEKAAALDVVSRRLREANLEDACLELHSRATNKRSLYAELQRTVEVAAPKVTEADLGRLEAAKAALNDYADGVNAPLAPFGVSPRDAMGRLVALGPGSPEGRHPFEAMRGWSEEEFRERREAVGRLQRHVALMGRPADHAYRGSKLDRLLPQDKADLSRRLAEAAEAMARLQASADALADALRVAPPVRASDVDRLRECALFVARAPDVSGVAIRAEWEAMEPSLRETIRQGVRLGDILSRLAHPEAIERDVAPLRNLLRLRPLLGERDGDFSVALDAAAADAFALADGASSLARELGVPAPTSLSEMEPLAALAQRAASAPDVRGMAVSTEEWKASGSAVEEALGAVRRFQEARAQHGAALTEAAWGADVRGELAILEQHGGGFFRFLNGAYRRAMATSARHFALPGEPLERAAALRAVVAAREAEATLARHRGRMGALFGERWEGARSDAGLLAEAAAWIGEAHAGGKIPLATLQAIERGAAFAGAAEGVRSRASALARSLDGLGAAVGPLPEGAYEHIVGPLRAGLPEVGRVVGAGDFSHAFSALDLVAEAQGLRARIRAASPTALPALGSRWRAEETDWGWAQTFLDWMVGFRRAVRAGELPEGLIGFFAEARPRAGLDAAVRRAHEDRAAAQEAVGLVVEAARLPSIVEETLEAQRGKIARWTERIDDLPAMIRLNVLVAEAAALGLDRSIALAEAWPLAGEGLVDAFERGWYDGIVRQAMAERPALARFDRRGHEETAAAFRELDDLALRTNRARVALAHWRSVPRGLAGGAMGWLGIQFALTRGHKPIRVAMERAGEAIQAIKPVFLMSPLSIATVLPADGPRFDVVIFDEASQVKPEDAFGAILRASQTIVVGDSRQMPPTSFFDKLTSEEEEDEESDGLGELESVLAMMSAKLPARSPRRRDLRWHYRSRHDALIATSNRLFYDDRLVVFPSPWRGGADGGLILRHDPTTVYGRGGTRKNVEEARTVARAARDHVRAHPKLTLGVAAFSKAQQEAIQDEIDALRREEPAFAAFDAAHPFEPLFVKNLENVQGDERDVILISVGYGRDENGLVPASFGPLNRAGGERRLNVLITRARVRCEVFTNLGADDIRLTPATPAGVAALRTFLSFATTGSLDVPSALEIEAPSDFERAIAERLRSAGYDVAIQVGTAGFYLDVAVRHPERPERLVLGIQGDGAMYRRARTARDRDKLRQAALEARGWRLHRVWSADWFHDPDREFERLTAAIAAALGDEGIEEASARPSEYVELERDETPVLDQGVEPYVFCDLKIPGAVPIPELPPSAVAGWIVEIVAAESPVHLEEATRRIREAAGLGQAGAKVRAAIEAAAALAAREGRVERRGDFLYDPSQAATPLRSRAGLPAPARRIEMVAPEEATEALARVVRQAFGIERDEAAVLAARSLGFERATAGISDRLRELIEREVEHGRFEDDGGVLRIAEAP